MKTEVIENKRQKSTTASKQSSDLRLARRADHSSVVIALPQPGGADLLRAKKQLKKRDQK